MIDNKTQWLFNEYNEAFVREQIFLTEEERIFFLNFINTQKTSASKIIFYNALLILKKSYPKFVLSLYINMSTKKYLKAMNAPKRLRQSYRIIGSVILDHVIIKYCKQVLHLHERED